MLILIKLLQPMTTRPETRQKSQKTNPRTVYQAQPIISTHSALVVTEMMVTEMMEVLRLAKHLRFENQSYSS